MSILELHDEGGYLAFDENQCSAAGAAMHNRYVNAYPFPHIVLDDFIDRDVLRRVDSEFPSAQGHQPFNRSQERLKYQYTPRDWHGATTRNLFAELNSLALVRFLEKLTGITGLITDPTFEGGGLHETMRGGRLGIHADFNVYHRLRILRQLNLLIYLNDDWLPDYGGALELWDKPMKECVTRVEPVLGRAVIFTTNLDSFHGQPDAVTCPPDRSRRSMALYYYAAPEVPIRDIPTRTTNFQIRPGSADKRDWLVKTKHLAHDWLPPVVRRSVKKVMSR